jgi:hypothetical protein
VREVVELRRRGFRFIALADDNFYPVTFQDLAQADRRADPLRRAQLQALREERFELMAQLARLPNDLVFYTQITMEAAEDAEFLDAMRRAHIRGALVGIESVTAAGLKDVYKGFNLAGDALVARLRAFRDHDIHVLGSFIFGLPSDDRDTFDATVDLTEQANLTFAQFVLLTPFPASRVTACARRDAASRAIADSGHRRLREVGRSRGQPRAAGARCSDHPTLADSQASAAEAVLAAPRHVARGHSRRYAVRLGSFSTLAQRLGTLACRHVLQSPARLRAGVPTVSTDVRQHGDRHGQRARRSIHSVGPLARTGDSAIVPNDSDAAAPGARTADGSSRQSPDNRSTLIGRRPSVRYPRVPAYVPWRLCCPLRMDTRSAVWTFTCAGADSLTRLSRFWRCQTATRSYA